MHTIRLRSAWRDSEKTHSRRFNRPTGLDNGETVWIAVDEATRIESASLNGEPLSLGGSTVRCDVTLLLKPSNELVLILESAEASRLLATVRIEIEN